ncbi:MAG: cation:proton antiporter, partial [Anaerolineae bacterium]|nr:cation:proton antiporter [Anaerolineae bacterium]
GLINTSHGQAAVGWLVMEDILSVLILVLMPALSMTSGSFDWINLLITLLKAAAFILIMFFAGSRLIPWLLEHIAQTRSRELFILVVLAVTLGTAMGASELFGVSLALGAFMAGAIISQSRLSHQVGADVFAFREAFSVLFFVSIGMLVNPTFLWQNWAHILWLTVLVVAGKTLIVLIMGLFFPRPARTFLTVAIGLSQIGEFSFILGQSGLSLNLLDGNQYSLILATALISITLNPFMYKLLPILENGLKHLPGLWKKLESAKDFPEIVTDHLNQHVIVIGFGRVGKHLVDVLESLQIPILVAESDSERIALLYERNIQSLYGDASNLEILSHTHPEHARAVVITIANDEHAAMIVNALKEVAPEIPIIARATTEEGVKELSALGARYIVHPELEGGLEMVHHTLLTLGFPLRQVHEYAEAVRRDSYNTSITTHDEYRSLHDLLHATHGIEITWFSLPDHGTLIGQTLAEANIRQKTGASVVAIIRNGQLIANPKSNTSFEADDHIGIIGDENHVENARILILGDD